MRSLKKSHFCQNLKYNLIIGLKIESSYFKQISKFIDIYSQIFSFSDEIRLYNQLISFCNERIERFEKYNILISHLKIKGSIYLVILVALIILSIAIDNGILILFILGILVPIPFLFILFIIYPRKRSFYLEIIEHCNNKLTPKEETTDELFKLLFPTKISPIQMSQIQYCSLISLFIEKKFLPDNKKVITKLFHKIYDLDFKERSFINEIVSRRNNVSINAEADVIYMLGFKKESIEKALDKYK